MPLTNLPTELLDIIIQESIPESLLNLATTSKRIYGLCKPFLNRHNERHDRFRDFGFNTRLRDRLVAASDLISIIADDPTVARYIRVAGLLHDSRYLIHARVYWPQKSVPAIEEGGAIVQLFASSTYLQRAKLDWKEYYSVFAEDVKAMRYSQHGSAFLLTLLMNAETLEMPAFWKPNAATNKLLEVLATEAHRAFAPSSGLRSLRKLIGPSPDVSSGDGGSSWALSFLALPSLTSFHVRDSVILLEDPRALLFRDPPFIASMLQAVHLIDCYSDDVGISAFLRHTPNLKTLIYTHTSRFDDLPEDWDICKFINAVAYEAGSHLVEFSVRTGTMRGSILPGRVSTRGFQKLKKFEFPQELLMNNIHATGSKGPIATSLQYFFNGSFNPLVYNLIPPSVTHLSLDSKGMGPFDVGLDALMRNFGAVRRSKLPNLKWVQLVLQPDAIQAYRDQCDKIAAEGKRLGVTVNISWSASFTIEKWGP